MDPQEKSYLEGLLKKYEQDRIRKWGGYKGWLTKQIKWIKERLEKEAQ
jgi:hypothetical protein